LRLIPLKMSSSNEYKLDSRDEQICSISDSVTKSMKNSSTLPDLSRIMSINTLETEKEINGGPPKSNKPKTKAELFAERHLEHPTSNTDTLMHILKANIGTGILAMPDAIKNSGLTVGTIGLVIIAILCTHCMHIVVKCSRHLCIRSNLVTLDYASCSEVAFATGPQRCQKMSTFFRFLTNLFLCITMLGFCCVYILFVSTNIKQVVDALHGAELDYRIYETIILVPIVLICLIRNLKFLVPASIIANICEIVSLAIIFYYICQDLPRTNSRKQWASIAQLPLYFGTAIFAFEGIGLVLPLENNMKTPQDFGGLTGVLNTGMVIVSSLYIAVGFYGYMKYGEYVLGSITLNLPNEIPAYIVCCSYSFAIFLSYAIQFYVPIQLMFPTIKSRISQRYQYPVEIAFRIAIILITYAFAVLIPELDSFISLVGAFSGSYLSLILPPIIEMVTYWNEGLRWYTIVKDIFILIIGILGCVTGTYSSISSIIS